MSLQLGKPWMIELTEFIVKSDSWHQVKFSVPGCDLLLAAFVSLRMTGSETLELASSAQQNSHHTALFKMLNSSVTSWDQKWLPSFDTGGQLSIRFLAT